MFKLSLLNRLWGLLLSWLYMKFATLVVVLIELGKRLNRRFGLSESNKSDTQWGPASSFPEGYLNVDDHAILSEKILKLLFCDSE